MTTTEQQFANLTPTTVGKPLTQRQYLAWLRSEMRHALRVTQQLDAKWNRINDEINDKLDRQGVRDIVQRASLKGASIPLSDALNSGKWWREKAVYLATILQAELAYDKRERS